MADITLPLWALAAAVLLPAVCAYWAGRTLAATATRVALKRQLTTAHETHEMERRQWTREKEELLSTHGRLVAALRKRASRRTTRRQEAIRLLEEQDRPPEP